MPTSSSLGSDPRLRHHPPRERSVTKCEVAPSSGGGGFDHVADEALSPTMHAENMWFWRARKIGQSEGSKVPIYGT